MARAHCGRGATGARLASSRVREGRGAENLLDNIPVGPQKTNSRTPSSRGADPYSCLRPRKLGWGSKERRTQIDSLSTVAEIVSGTAEPAFATNAGGTILAWNRAAEQLLGHDAVDAVGERCYSLLSGRDIFGNTYCNPHCPLLGMVQRHEPVARFEILVESASGAMTRIGVSVLVVPDGNGAPGGVVHILRAGPETPTGARQANDLEDGRFASLTPRESEVLCLMADGLSTAEIAEKLFIGATTVRHHVQSILGKLDVHSRLGAVVAFHRVPTRLHQEEPGRQ